MSRIFNASGAVCIKVIRDLINTWSKKPCVCTLEEFDKNCPSMMVQQLAASEKLKEYVNGSYIASVPFAVYMRVNGRDSASKIDAIAILDELGSWLTERDADGRYTRLPSLDANRQSIAVELNTTPSVAASYEDGTQDYQAVFMLEYKYRRN